MATGEEIKDKDPRVNPLNLGENAQYFTAPNKSCKLQLLEPTSVEKG